MSISYENSRPSCCRAPLESSAATLAADLKRFGRRILVLYGASLPDDIQKILADAGEEFRLFEMSGAEPSPLDESVEVGAAICRYERIDVLLAVGSDTVKDFAVRIGETFRQRNSAGRSTEIVFVRIS